MYSSSNGSLRVAVWWIGAVMVCCSAAVAEAQTCDLYPMAVSTQSLAGVAPGIVISNILNGAQPGNFGWLTWAGSPSVPTLVRSLTPPGDSDTYVNPDDPDDHVVSVGDWVQGKPGVSNSKNVRDALDVLKTVDIVVPIWDRMRGQGNNADYRVAALALIRLISYSLPGQNKITARFLGYATCGQQNQPPVVDAGPDQVITSPSPAYLQGTVTDDGLPVGSVVGVQWSVVSGTGSVTFSCATCLVTTASFSDAGGYTLRLTASDSLLEGSDDVTINVNAPNHPPEAEPQEVSTPEDTPLAITLAGSDPDSDALNYFIETPPSFGALSGTPPAVVYTPTNDYNGPDSFTFKVSDGQLESSPATVSITVTPVNDAPVAEDLGVTNLEDTAVLIQMSGADVDGDAITYEIAGNPLFGTLGEVSSNTVLYTPYPDNYGTDRFYYQVTDGALYSRTATVSIATIPVNDPPIAHDQSVALNEDTAAAITLTGSDVDDDPLTFEVVDLPTNGALSGSPPDLVYTPAANFFGDDSFSFVVSDSSVTSAPSVVQVVVLPVNDPPVADAGLDFLVDVGATNLLAGSGTDVDPGAVVTGTWSVVSGPGSVTFGDNTSFTTAVIFSQAGVYVLRLTVSDGFLSDSDDVTITVNAPPEVSAGPDLIVAFPGPADLDGLVSDDGRPPGVPLSVAWHQAAGPGAAFISNPVSVSCSVRFTKIGDYTLRLSATDSRLMASDEVNVSVRPAGPNQAPVVNAGPDQTIGLTSEAALEGSISDDSLPWGSVVSSEWSLVSGPGTVTFADPHSALGTVEFSQPGTYVLRLSASDSELENSDEVTITVYPANLPPTVDAGPDQTISTPSAQLAGHVSDDGLPSGVVAVEWTPVSGPGSATFGNRHSAIGNVQFSQAGTYVLRLTASDGQLTTGDELSITVSGNLPPVVDAGPDQTLELFVPPPTLAYSNPVPPVLPEGWKYEIGQPGLTGTVAGCGGPNCGPSVPDDCMVFMSNDVYVAGAFRYAGGRAVWSVARWDGCGWNPLIDPWITNNPASGSGTTPGFTNGFTTDGYFNQIAEFNGKLYANGYFLATYTNGALTYGALATWNGAHWARWPFPRLTWGSYSPFAMASGSDGVYFGGSLRWSDGTTNSYGTTNSHLIAKWNGTNWVAMDAGIYDTNSSYWGWAGSVHTIAVAPNGNVFAGGSFTAVTHYGAAKNVARWDGTNWYPLGSGLAGRYGQFDATLVYGMTVATNGDLYVGGNFTNAGGITAYNVARWDGSNWYALGSGLPGGAVRALAFRGTNLYVSGSFIQAGGQTANRLARWNGISWSSVGSGTSNGLDNYAASMVDAPDGLYVGGGFTMGGGRPASRITKWGQDVPPTLNTPLPVTAWATGPAGAEVTLSAVVGHRCGIPLTVTWNVDGGPAEYTNVVVGAAPPLATAFTNLYSVGLHTVTITMNDGKTPPQIGLTTVVIVSPAAAVLNGTITDDGLPLGITNAQWSLVSGPSSVVLGCSTCPVTTASFTQVGTYVLRLTGSDTEYTNWDEMTVQVSAIGSSNYPPSVDAGLDQQIGLGESASLNGVATDDGLPSGVVTMEWTQVSGPGNSAFGNRHSALTTVSFDHPGTYLLRLTASDGELSAHDDVSITMSAVANQPPSVDAGPDQAVMFAEGEPLAYAQLNGTASDDGLPWGMLNSQWSKTDGPGNVLFRYRDGQYYAVFASPGTYTLRLTASDGQLEASDDVTVTVLAFVPPPLLEITSPTNTQQVTAPTPVLGTVDSPVLASWTLQVREVVAAGDSPWQTLSTGSTSTVNGELGTVDPTLSLNGTYELRLVASDLGGRSATSEAVNVVFDGNMKVGLFTLSFEDLSVPLEGIPIQVIRTYDSRAAMAGREGDFGVGWTLSLKDLRLQKNRPLGARWYQEIVGFSALGLPVYEMSPKKDRVITVTLPDNQVFRFKAVFSPTRQTGVPIVSGEVVFEPLAGTYGTLAVEGESAVQVVGDVPYYDPFGGPSRFSGYVDLMDLEAADDFEPQLFRFTTQDGTAYIVHETDGLQRVYDLNSNEVIYASSGIYHSSGQSVQFIRDAQNRIVQILDPSSNAVTYGYDTNRNLRTFTDRATNTTTYSYSSSSSSSHLLEDILDPRGIRAIRGEYDSSGRLIRQTDADGNPIVFTHDIENRRETITDRLGHVTVHEYEDRGNVVRTIDALTNITTRTYDELDNELTTTDPLGKTSTNSYDSQGNKLSESDPLGNATRYTYSSLAQPLTITDARGNTTRYTYDAKGNLLSEQDGLSNLTMYAYDSRGNMLSRTDALGNVTSNEYDGLGRLVRTTQPVAGAGGPGVVTTYTYDSNGNRTTDNRQLTTPTGTVWLVTSNKYDAQNRLIETIHPDGSVTRTEYNSIAKESARIDALGRTTSYEYDDRGNLTATRYSDGSSETNYYDAENRRFASVDRMGRTTTYTYDPLGRLTDTIAPDGATQTSIYDELGRVVSSIDAHGNETQYEYDPNCGCPNRRAKVIDALGHETTFEYDESGNQTAMHDANGHTTRFAYDALNRQTVVTFHDGTTKVTTYDSLGRRIAETDQAGLTTQYRYDGLGRLTNVVDALNQVTSYGYDEAGNLIRQTDANSHTTRFEYDSMGRRVKRTLPEGQIEAYAYDAVGNVTNKVDFKGKATTFAYDSMSRLVAKQPDASFAASNIVFAYNASGQRLSMSDQTGVTTYEYDSRDRLLEKATPIGSLLYGYDAQGNLTNLWSSNSNGVWLAYTYDELNRLKGVNDYRSGLTAYNYDNVGNLEDFILPNGVSQVYDYDALNRLTNVAVNRLTTPIESYAYTLGPSGHRLAVQEGNGRQVTYQYDNLYRLTREAILGASPLGDVSYTPDPVGNRIAMNSTVLGIPSQVNTFDANDRLGSDSYDAGGNTTAGTIHDSLAGTDIAFTYAYDFENRLVSATSAASVVQILYDGDGNRVEKRVTDAFGTRKTRYLVDDRNPTGYSQVLEEYSALDSGPWMPDRIYTVGLDVISQARVMPTNEVTYFYGYDGHGNVRFLTDTNGFVTDRWDYDAYGNIIARSGTTANNLLYCGEYRDPDLGLYFLRARYMEPGRGRFWTMDEWDGRRNDPLSLHKYLYADSDPVNRGDPTGRISEYDIAAVTMNTVATATIRVIPRGHTQVKPPTSNGCSSPMGDEPILGCSFKLACDLHDICYSTCGSQRDLCDTAFHKNLEIRCTWSELSGEKLEQCKQLADEYYIHVSVFGRIFYWLAQRRHCE